MSSFSTKYKKNSEFVLLIIGLIDQAYYYHIKFPQIW